MQANPGFICSSLKDALKGSITAFDKLLYEIVRNKQSNIYLAGGAVRDAFLENGNEVKDLDIFLSLNAFNQISSFLIENGNLMTNPFGNYRWYPKSNPLFYFDIIIINNFFNGLWQCQDIIDVLNQFDITINAIAFDLYTGQFYNPQNGLRDINARILRAVRFDYPDLDVSQTIPISRNAVIWFRYVYYARKLGLQVESLTQSWIEDNRYRESEIELFKKYFFDPYNL